MKNVFVKRNKDAFAVLAREFAKKCKSLGMGEIIGEINSGIQIQLNREVTGKSFSHAVHMYIARHM